MAKHKKDKELELGSKQVDIKGHVVLDRDMKVRECLDHVSTKTALKQFYPGEYFGIELSDKAIEKLDDIGEDGRRREFIIKKLKLIPGKQAPAHSEGIAYQDDLETLLHVLFVIDVPHMSPESFEAFMKGEKKTKAEELRKIAKAAKEQREDDQGKIVLVDSEEQVAQITEGT